MDESLSDFQEKKKSCTGPKTNQTVPTKSKKYIKRIKGQKDIRSVLKPKKNDLIAHATDFYRICKQSGVDVDPEQLQLAIALSESLKETIKNTTNQVDNNCTSKAISSQERTGKIRTTLQEYGFKVPDLKIAKSKHRVSKKAKKHYKLLLTTESEKQQIITDRYSQVLVNNLDQISLNSTDQTLPFCYRIATESTYDFVKEDNLFYIEGLIQKTSLKVGSLLKEWSKIPGRPPSPAELAERLLDFNFNAIECSQEELDKILSGSLKLAQNIVKNKHSSATTGMVLNKSKLESETETRSYNLHSGQTLIDTENMEIDVITVEATYHTNKTEIKKNLNTPIQVRSCSPDIFDDDVLTILEHEDKTSQDVSNNYLNANLHVMDLTECKHNQNAQKNIKEISCSQLPQANKSKRISNDFLELTSCVAGSSQPLVLKTIQENVDLTQSSGDSDVTIAAESKIAEQKGTKNFKDSDIIQNYGDNDVTISNKTEKHEIVEFDLTQSSNSSDELPFVQISGKETQDDTVLLSEKDYVGIIENPISSTHDFITLGAVKNNCSSNTCAVDRNAEKGILPSYDLNPLRSKIVEINVVNESGQNVCNSNKNTIINDASISIMVESGEKNNTIEINSPRLIESPVQCNAESDFFGSETQSFYEEFVHSHSDASSEKTEVPHFHENPISGNDGKNRKYQENIDLTQSSNDSLIIADENEKPKSFDKSSLGKIDNVSIDYDELLDNVYNKNSTISTSKRSNESLVDENSMSRTHTNSERTSKLNSSQSPKVFEINDKDWDCSMQQSRHDINRNLDFGGISVVDNIPDLPSLRQTTIPEIGANKTLNRSKSDSFLPEVAAWATKASIEKNVDPKSPPGVNNKLSTVFKQTLSKEINTETPENYKYIVKTNEVTPLQDYESMTTPERNRELDKYGLKPFKRKRAIQLLTHLYNQTHPIVEAHSIEQSPPKKAKHDHQSQPVPSKPSLITQKSPVTSQKSVTTHYFKSPLSQNTQKVTSKSPRETGCEKENNIYEITNFPDVKDVQCDEEDWVFQKREKVKLYSCRMPLHIAFHNYVTSRRGLREAILQYEPVHIDVIHRGLADSGLKFDPKDLLKFMDKKCIAVKTADNAKNNRNHY